MPTGDGRGTPEREEGGGGDALVPEQSTLAEPGSDISESVPVRAAQEEARGDENETGDSDTIANSSPPGVK